MLGGIIQQLKRNVTSIQELEEKYHLISFYLQRLHELGQAIGNSLVEIFFWKERGGRRDQQLLPLLLRIKNSFWKEFFGFPADALERSLERDNECRRKKHHSILTSYAT